MDHVRIDAEDMTLIVACAIGAPPHFLHWGKRLSSALDAADIEALSTRQGMHGAADRDIGASFALEPGLGLLGPPGFSAHRAGKDWGSLFLVQSVEHDEDGVRISCTDFNTALRLDYRIVVDAATGVMTLGTTLTNDGTNGDNTPLDLVEMATACLPIPQKMNDIIGFTGRWTQEFHRERFSRFAGAYLRENRRGRTSHDSFPAVILCTADTNEAMGEAYGIHLAWSGNHRVRVDSLSDGRVFVSLGALLLPGEVRLAPGESHVGPQIVAGYAAQGLSQLSQKFHRHVRQNILRPSTRSKPRPVHYNTWEAVYFDHDLDRLKGIADRAAAIGVERFVLDDGWFGARRNDAAGLGDWTISDAVYPDGLAPLVDHVTGLGMEMGIWFEPEMVNPDSDLYRAHPDWVLRLPGIPQMPFRNQFVLDIARREVSDYLFNAIDRILTDHAIGYIKWDMNRDLSHPGDAVGKANVHAHVLALWALLDRIRAAHPHVEIESCASGGGRIDYGILSHTDRVWTSDTNDAIDRQAIQRGASMFFPLEVLGAHVGPKRCHVTGRTLSLGIRAATALMGHMGLELNVLTEPNADLEELKKAIALYKDHRGLLHSGMLYRIDTPQHLTAMGVVALNLQTALFSVGYMTGTVHVLPDRLYCVGLDPAVRYCVRLVWPQGWTAVKAPSVVETLNFTGDGHIVSGEALMTIGLQLPVALPETVLLFHLRPA
jgi:alpha-galactosidase